jgi:hypothetical protein
LQLVAGNHFVINAAPGFYPMNEAVFLPSGVSLQLLGMDKITLQVSFVFTYTDFQGLQISSTFIHALHVTNATWTAGLDGKFSSVDIHRGISVVLENTELKDLKLTFTSSSVSLLSITFLRSEGTISFFFFTSCSSPLGPTKGPQNHRHCIRVFPCE